MGMRKKYSIEVDCANCANKMEEAAGRVKHVKAAEIDFLKLEMTIEFEDGADEKEVMEAVVKACKRVEEDCEVFLPWEEHEEHEHEEHEHHHEHHHEHGECCCHDHHHEHDDDDHDDDDHEHCHEHHHDDDKCCKDHHEHDHHDHDHHEHDHHHDDDDDDDDDDDEDESMLPVIIRIVLSTLITVVMFILEKTGVISVPESWAEISSASDIAVVAVFLVSYLIIGYDLLFKAVKNIARGQFLDEIFLMAVASVGAMALCEFT